MSEAIETAPVAVRRIQERILTVRGHRVILDSDLAAMYGVETRRLNEQVKRNSGRFPPDFMFQLTRTELALLKSQFATTSSWGGSRKLPYVFTEHGAIMAASVLNSERAVSVSVFVVRAFVKLREMLSSHRELAVKLDLLEQKLQRHDGQIVALIDAIRQLMAEPATKPKPRIGFVTSGQQET